MKKLILSEMMLLSPSEKKAKLVKFDQRRTLIFGANGTGKSCLIKSIYKCFGAYPYKDHPTWERINPILHLRFSIDDIEYSILKDNTSYALYNAENRLIKAFIGGGLDFHDYLGELFSFKIKLTNRRNELTSLSPSFLFLPYYIDQDISWQTNWSSFKLLGKFINYREPIASYHTGIKPNEYYAIKGEIERLSRIEKEWMSERKVLNNVIGKFKTTISQTEFNLNQAAFKEEIKELLGESNQLKIKQEKLKELLSDLEGLKTSIEFQLNIAKNTRNQSNADYQYALKTLIDDSVDCPTCGAHYSNTFIERFEIAKDEDRCNELIVDLTRELEEINVKITKANENYSRNDNSIKNIEALLEKRKGDLKLQDLIENAGKNEMKIIFKENSRTLLDKIHDNHLKIEKLEVGLKAFLDDSRIEEIMNTYYFYLRSFLSKLDIQPMDEDEYSKIDTYISETGSALPRALIAYYFSIFHVMNKFTSSTYCPIVIDSPNQQAQDLKHVDKILQFINTNQPDASQLILGVEELYDVDFNCKIIELKNTDGLLQEEDFEEVKTNILPYQIQLWNYNRKDQLL